MRMRHSNKDSVTSSSCYCVVKFNVTYLVYSLMFQELDTGPLTHMVAKTKHFLHL